MQSANKFPRKTPKREKTTLSSSSESDKPQDPVNVYCRLKPLKDDNEESCIKLVSPTVLCLSSPTESKVLRRDVQYGFKHIFTSQSTQKDVFEHVAYPLLKDLLKGKNGLLFTYGVTGSGKTYTLSGEQNNPGIMPRCIDTLFNTIGDLQAKKFVIKSDKMNGFEVQTDYDAEGDRVVELKASAKTMRPLRKATSEEKIFYANDGSKVSDINEGNFYAVFVSYIEIYNNTVFDLLDSSGGKSLQSKILREDAQKNMYVNNVVEVEVKSAVEAYELYNAGQRRKRMGHTLLNAESSRSHSIFNIRVVQLQQDIRNSKGNLMIPERNFLKIGQLSLVDLAGSERCSRTQNTGMRLKEASSINNSLMSLRSCLEILRDNQLNNANRLVPYRDSRLTLLFKNYFEGQGLVNMIVCANPSAQDYEENLQVMKFAEITQEVKVNKTESRYTPYRRVQKVTRPYPQTPVSTKVHNAPPLVFGPKVPVTKFNLEDTDSCEVPLLKLIKTLRTRRDKREAFRKENAGREHNFRKRLLEIDQENVLSRSELRSLKALFKKERQKCQNLETKVLDLETVNNNLVFKAEELHEVIRSLKYTIDEKDLKINQNFLEKERSKRKLAMEKEKRSQEVDAHLRRQREELHAEMQAKDLKLQKVKQILDSKENYVESPRYRSEIEVQTDNRSQQTVQTPKSEQQTPQSVQQMPLHHRPVVSSNRRRSRSVGEVWLEHNSVKPVPLGTVLQPSMKRRKSVTKLSKASDITHPKQSKYCLIAQEADGLGDVETKVYKGDIVSTCGGGAQVIFNDVERLRQESPTGTPTK